MVLLFPFVFLAYSGDNFGLDLKFPHFPSIGALKVVSSSFFLPFFAPAMSDRPSALREILIPAASLLSAATGADGSCGDDMTATLTRLASAEPYGNAPEGAMPEEAMQRALALAEKYGIAPLERTRELLAGLLMVAPLVEKARAAGIPPEEIGLVFGGTTSGTPEIVAALRSLKAMDKDAAAAPWKLVDIGRTASVIARALGIYGPVFTVSTACTASAKAILDGARLLSIGRVRAVVAGGVDILSPLTEGGFSALGARSERRARPFSSDRSGLHLGEGGGFLLLTTDEKAFPAAPVRLAGGGETSDAHHICAPEPNGIGASAAVEEALKANFTGHAVSSAEVGFALLHGTATAQNDAMEAKVAAATLPQVPCASLKRAVGHQLAGAGGFNAAVAWGLLAHPKSSMPLNFQEDTAGSVDAALDETMGCVLTRPDQSTQSLTHPRILVTAYAFGGSNAALLLEARS